MPSKTNNEFKKPAVVQYNGKNGGRFTNGKCYDAFFLEYWQGVRDSLHVCGDNGEVTDFNHFQDFSVINDEDHLLNNYEATVKCVTHEFDDELFDLNYGKEYKAIGINKDGLYLVMDESYDCYFYEPTCFEIIEDTHNILNNVIYWWK